MKEWFRIAVSASVRKRALRVATVVGAILIAINHGDAVLNGDLSTARLLRMALTLIVPYLVSTFSSVGAIYELRAMQRSPVPVEERAELERLAS